MLKPRPRYFDAVPFRPSVTFVPSVTSLGFTRYRAVPIQQQYQRRWNGTTRPPPNEPSTPKSEIAVKLKEWQELARTTSQAHVSSWATSAGKSLVVLAEKVNQLTGYELIEDLKRRVVEQESRIEDARVAARAAKLAYENAVSERSQCQREVNDLLQRKSSWSENDVVRFTNLVRQDHLNEQNETRTKAESTSADQAIEQEFQALTRAILNRYHEEQVWSDKIRSASTYGSLIVMGLNLFVFVLAIIVVEPYKRRKMAETFEKRIESLSLETNTAVERIASRIDSHLDKQQSLLVPLIASSPDTATESSIDDKPYTNTTIITIPVERRDAIMVGLGATAATVACVILAFLRS